MWGIPILHAPSFAPLRNTPTHVGNTLLPDIVRTRNKKHPHACGEYYFLLHPPVLEKETPPRMWGIPTPDTPIGGQARNTPTHVGNTFLHHEKLLLKQKHPHACGEYFVLFVKPDSGWETPPRMWGIQSYLYQYLSFLGNTPTHVGNTLFAYVQSVIIQKHPTHVGNTKTAIIDKTVGQKHPHACGEYIGPKPNLNPRLETPPRMWGILLG